MAPIIHGHARRTALGRNYSPEYRAWRAMKNRCNNRNQARYADYGGRGITVCPRWLYGDGTRNGFLCFLSDVGHKPNAKMSLGRIDNDRGYEPGNVRWFSQVDQARNTRATRSVSIKGMTISFAEAVERFGAVSMTTARMRVFRGWDDVAAITTPSKAPQPTA